MNKRKKGLIFMVLGGLGLVLAFGLSFLKGDNVLVYGTVEKNDIILETVLPIKGEFNLPITIKGKAKGTMFFEGSFPAMIEDASGVVLFTNIATAKGEWMTEDYVLFGIDFKEENQNKEIEKDFIYNTKMPLVLHLKKDNPSGLVELDGGAKIIFVK